MIFHIKFTFTYFLQCLIWVMRGVFKSRTRKEDDVIRTISIPLTFHVVFRED